MLKDLAPCSALFRRVDVNGDKTLLTDPTSYLSTGFRGGHTHEHQHWLQKGMLQVRMIPLQDPSPSKYIAAL